MKKTSVAAHPESPDKATLHMLFVEHLRAAAPDQNAALAAALRDAGFNLEAALLPRVGWTEGAGEKRRRTFVGRHPPADAAPGQLWLDTVEVMPMVLVEEPARGKSAQPRRSWLATRPVARWQFRAFAAAAPLVGRKVQVVPKLRPFAADRLAAGSEQAPMTDITHGEATLYAHWFGKGVAGPNERQGAARTLGDQFATLWAPGLREWAGYSGADDSLRIRVGQENWHRAADGTLAATGAADEGGTEMLARELDHDRQTGFRTSVFGSSGLLTGAPGKLSTFEPVALAKLFPR
jgi:hypothetical protein